MLVLGIETSCDETAVAIVEDGRRIRASIVSSQVARHKKWGGVVPEIAAREHTLGILPVLHAALQDARIDLGDLGLVAVTREPGLIGSLLLGVAAAEALAQARALPIVGVNHVEAHLVAPFLVEGENPEYPLLSLVVSGGHTHVFRSANATEHELLGATLDDAAGEAFDKVAAALGLGYPGGPAVERAAQGGNPRAFPFKRPILDPDALDVSFSGLKTAVRYRCFGQNADGRARTELLPGVTVPDVAASFQAAVVDTLVEKVSRAVAMTGIRRVAVGGGVACNGPLRTALAERGAKEGFAVHLTPPALCTDNAAMVASQGYFVWRHRGPDAMPLQVRVRGEWKRAPLGRCTSRTTG